MAITEQLPGLLREIAEIAGEAAALRVAQARGGTRAYIPRPENLSATHWLVQALGLEPARELASIYQGEHLDIPLGPHAGNQAAITAAITRGLAEGRSAADIARAVGVTERTVTNHRARQQRRQQQYSLFS